MYKKYLMAMCIGLFCHGALHAQAVFHNEASDTVRINEMLISGVNAKLPSPGEAVAFFAERFVGTPYESGTLEGAPERLRINLDQMDCTTFAESMLALAMTVDEHRSSWRDFAYNLQQLRYRGGKIDGYASRLHYIADWAVDNVHRGNLTDVTSRFPKCNYAIKTLDFMSANKDKYPALADSATLAQLKKVEIGYRRHRFPYIKTSDLALKNIKEEFRTGDVVAMTSSINNLDVAHMGIIVIKNGEPYLVHASSSAGKVVITELPLDKFMKKNRQFTGVRVFRLNNQ